MIRLVAKEKDLQKFDKEIPFDNFKDVIDYLYKYYTSAYDLTEKTYNINDEWKSLIKGRRSVKSTYNIVKYYFPKTTNKEFFSYLKELVVNDKLIIHYCGVVKNFVCVRYIVTIKESVHKTDDNNYNVFNIGYGSRVPAHRKIKGISYNELINTFTELNK